MSLALLEVASFSWMFYTLLVTCNWMGDSPKRIGNWRMGELWMGTAFVISIFYTIVLFLDERPIWMEEEEWSRGTASRGSRRSKYSMRKSNRSYRSGSRMGSKGGPYHEEDERKSMLQT